MPNATSHLHTCHAPFPVLASVLQHSACCLSCTPTQQSTSRHSTDSHLQQKKWAWVDSQIYHIPPSLIKSNVKYYTIFAHPTPKPEILHFVHRLSHELPKSGCNTFSSRMNALLHAQIPGGVPNKTLLEAREYYVSLFNTHRLAARYRRTPTPRVLIPYRRTSFDVHHSSSLETLATGTNTYKCRARPWGTTRK